MKMSKAAKSTANGAKKVAKSTANGAKKVAKTTKKVTKQVTDQVAKGAKKIGTVVVDQKEAIVQKGTLGVAAVLTVTAAANAAPASSGLESVSNENTITLTTDGPNLTKEAPSNLLTDLLDGDITIDLDIEVPKDLPIELPKDNPIANVAVSPVSSLLSGLKEVGKGILTKALASWGLEAINMIFRACGLNIFGETAAPNYVEYFNQINSKLDRIQKTLEEIQTQVTQNELVRVIDNFYSEFNAIKISIDPVLMGLADIADRENEGTEAEKEALMKEKAAFYESRVKALSPGTSFSEKVIALANLVTAPSSNFNNTLLKCFNTVNFDIPGIYTWDVQRTAVQEDFLGYVASTLMKATSIARYEISYQLSVVTSSSDKAYWNSADKNLCAAVDKALEVLQKDTDEVLRHDNQIQHGVFTHIATGISVNRRLGVGSFDPEKGHNVMTYSKTEKWTRVSAAAQTGYYLHFLNGPDDSFYEGIMKEYQTYIKAIGKTNVEFTFFDYLEHIGFVTNGKLSDYDGLFWKMEHEFSKDDETHLDAIHISKGGRKEDKKGRVGYIKFRRPSWKYHEGRGYSNEYLLFLQPNSDYVLGTYTRKLITSSGSTYVTEYASKKYPGADYDEAVEHGTLGYCDPSWS